MTYEAVKELIEEVGYPTAYYQFEEKTEQKPPFVVYYFPERDDMFADNRNYRHIERLMIELYTDEKDFDAEAAVEAVLEANDIPYMKTWTYIDAELLYMAIFEAEVLIETEGGGQ